MMTRMIKFGDLLTEENRLVEIHDGDEYACGGVRLHGNGVFIREYKLGIEIKKKFVQHVVKPDDIVYSTLFAKSGAFAIAGQDVSGAILSEKFPTFRLTDDRISLDYLKWFFRSGQLNRIAEEQATGMAAFSLSHLSKRKFLGLKVPVPSLDRQAEVVNNCLAADTCVIKCNLPIIQNTKLAEHFLSASAEKLFRGISQVKMSEIGEYMLRPATIFPDEQYMQVTVAMNHKGLRLRRICEGVEIKSPGQCYVREGDILFSRIDIRQGAIGLVGKDLDGGVVTRDFPVFRLNETTENALQFLRFVFLTPSFMAQAKEASRGTTGRKKLKRNLFLDFLIPWPSMLEQTRILEELTEIQEHASKLNRAYRTQNALIKSLGSSVIANLYAKDANLI
jgi:type I restriction enzyme S subunit